MKILALIMMVVNLGLNTETQVYPMTAEVVGFDCKRDIVTIIDFGSENYFSFYGVEDWQIGDVVSLIMSDNGTPWIYDDIILDYRYSGFTTETPETMPILTCGE